MLKTAAHSGDIVDPRNGEFVWDVKSGETAILADIFPVLRPARIDAATKELIGSIVDIF